MADQHIQHGPRNSYKQQNQRIFCFGKQTLFAKLAALPDILLFDIQLSPKDGGAEDTIGLDIIPWLREWFGRTPPVVVYSQFDDYAHANAALSFGVQGYVCKCRDEATLEAALHAALRGEVSIDQAVEPKFKHAGYTQNLLTRREAEILTCIWEGKSNKQIADALCISIRMVENHLSRIYYKTGSASRAGLRKM